MPAVKDWELLDQADDQQRTHKCAPSIIDARSLGEFLPLAPFACRDLLDRAIIPSANAEVAKVERLLNARPRKSLGFRSPQEVFHSLAYS
jgi:hypothetical protein